MHETTQRLVCRMLFLVVVLLPTATLAALAIYGHRPGRAAPWRNSMSAALGLDVRLDDVTAPRPGLRLFHQLQLLDPETHEVLFAAETVEQWRRNGRVVLVVSGAEVSATHLQQLVAILNDEVLRFRQPGDRPIELVAQSVNVESEAAVVLVTDVRGRVDEAAEGPQARIELRVDGVETKETVQLMLLRQRNDNDISTAIQLHTGGSPLPCRWLTLASPAAAALGDAAHFNGSAWVTLESDGWTGELSGRFSDVDLGMIMGKRFVHELTGTGELVVRRARVESGRLVQAAGTVQASDGVVSRSLLEAAVEHLGCRLSPDIRLPPNSRHEPTSIHSHQEGVIRYDQLAAGFLLNADGVAIHGDASPVVQGALLVDQRGPLLVEPAFQPLSTTAFVRALVPDSNVQVPATRQTDWLIGRLPLPE